MFLTHLDRTLGTGSNGFLGDALILTFGGSTGIMIVGLVGVVQVVGDLVDLVDFAVVVVV